MHAFRGQLRKANLWTKSFVDVLERPTFRNTFEGKAFPGHLRISNLKAKPFADILKWPPFWSTSHILFEVLEGTPVLNNLEKPTCGQNLSWMPWKGQPLEIHLKAKPFVDI